MEINQVWPEWTEDCVLGEGSFGKVYRAKRMEFGRTFYSAIKVLTVPKSQQEVKSIRAQGMNDNEIYDYFRGLVDNLLNEITLMDNLKGAKNIVGIEDYKIIERQGEIGWDIFIRMELLTPFDSFVSNPEFSQKDVIKLGVDICSALEVCEQNNIVHRDIKPDNIFISRFGEYKLGDFGIARKLEVTQANLSRKGTLNYMAPEVYKSEEYGASVDLYSLGLVLYTLLNNNRIAFLPAYPQPISYKDNEEALSKRLSGQPLTLPCNAGASLGQVILKACAYYPGDRYQSATEFKNALIQEWNVLVQSGDNKEIGFADATAMDDRSRKLQNTTNDMTANGRLVVNQYAVGTTVLEPSQEDASDFVPSQDFYSQSQELSFSVPQSYSQIQGNGFCRILAWIGALAACVFGILVLAGKNLPPFQQTAGVSMLGVGLSILLAGRNKYAVGLGGLSLTVPYILEGVFLILDKMTHDKLGAIVLIVSALLLLFGAVVMISQKDIRFGGSLCACAAVIEWIFQIYQSVNHNFSMEQWHIFWNVTVLITFIWCYGYTDKKQDAPLYKILHIVGYVVGGATAAFALYTVVGFVPTLIG